MPQDSDPEAEVAEMLRMIRGHRLTQAVYIATKLGIPMRISKVPKDAGTLASELGAHPDRLSRLLRLLAALGVLTMDDEGRFGLTRTGELLREDVPGSLADAAVLTGEDFYRAWGDLLHTVKTGETAFDHLYGMGHFEHLARHPEDSAAFQRTMAMSLGATGPALAGYDLSGHRVVVDVGGGNGALLASLLRDHPHLRGILYDQAGAVVDAPKVLSSAGVEDRVRVRSGSMFDSVPEGGDLYVLSRVLHDWPDDKALAILKHCRRAIAKDGTLLIVDGVLSHRDPDPSRLMLDLQMMVMNGGRERTEDEWRALLGRAGFAVVSVRPSRPNQDLIEARAR